MKGKFVFHFKSGMKIIDRNGYQTMAQARSFMIGHNKWAKKDGDPIIKIIERTPPKSKPKKKTENSFLGAGIKMPSFRL